MHWFRRRDALKELAKGSRNAPPVIMGRGSRLWEFPGVASAVESTETQWLIDTLDHRWVLNRDVSSTVASWVPAGFASYARVFHPVPRIWGRDENGTPLAPVPLTLRWADVAEWSGQTLQAESNFQHIATPLPGRKLQTPDLHIADPASEPPVELLGSLATVLQANTSTPDECRFALWDGFGDLGLDSQGGPTRLRLIGRSYLLYTGSVMAATAFATRDAPHAPTLWWPADRAWFVGGDVDLDSTFVGGSKIMIDLLLQRPDIEALPTNTQTKIG